MNAFATHCLDCPPASSRLAVGSALVWFCDDGSEVAVCGTHWVQRQMRAVADLLRAKRVLVQIR